MTSSTILVEKGSLPDCEADVLVNLVCCNSPYLNKSGVLARSFLNAVGHRLQQEFAQQPMPRMFGSDVAVTSACGLNAKQIYHAAIRRYCNKQSIQLLFEMVVKCLSMAAGSRMSSIAFPTVGCGGLGYDPADVADCFVRAQSATDVNLKIHIVAFEVDMYDKFTAYVPQPSKYKLVERQQSSLTPELLKRKENAKIDNEYVSPSRLHDRYMTFWGSQEGTTYPSYWSYQKAYINTSVDVKRQPLDSKSPFYKEVEQLVIDTVEPDKIGHGQDAANLRYSKLYVKKIWAIENPSVYRRYYTKKKEMCLNAVVNQWPQVSGLLGEADVRTRRGFKHLDQELISGLNECYLLHGTRESSVDAIEKHGLDNRVVGNKAMFGKGVYLAESSTKADQYADDKASRVGNNQPLYMYVVRVLLGHTFICQKPTEFSKPPCTFPGCHVDVCRTHTSYFDSVIGTHRTDGSRLIFREFVVYDLSQTYPEYLVEYERQ